MEGVSHGLSWVGPEADSSAPRRAVAKCQVQSRGELLASFPTERHLREFVTPFRLERIENTRMKGRKALAGS